MKNTRTFLVTAALALGLTGTAFAGNFDNNVSKLTIESGALSVSASAVKDDLSYFDAKLRVYEGPLLGLESTSTVGAFRESFTDTVGFTAETQVWKTFRQRDRLYGGAELTYVVNSDVLDQGSAFITPKVGYEHALNDTFAAFAETGYTFDLKNDFKDQAGYVEAGLIVDNGGRFAFKPSVIKAIGNDVSDDVNAKAELIVRF